MPRRFINHASINEHGAFVFKERLAVTRGRNVARHQNGCVLHCSRSSPEPE